MNDMLTRVVATAAAVSLLAACGGGGGGGEATGTEEDPITLRFQSLAWQEASVEANRELVEQWNEQNPGIQVEYVQGDWGSVHDQLLTSFEGGDPPDIIHYEAAAAQVFARGGFLADLSDLMSDQFRSGIDDDIWATVQYEDHGTIGAPFLLESRLPLANKALFEEAGVAVPTPEDPWTWDEFQAAAQQLTDADTYGVAWPLASPANGMLNLSLNFGGTYFTESEDGISVEVGPEEMEVPRRIHEMLYEDQSAAPDAIGVNTTDALPGFFAGNYAMIFGAIWLRQQMVQQAPEGFEWVTIPPLAGTAGQTQAANPQILSVAAQSEYPEAATQFIEFFLNPDNMALLAQGDWLIPTSEGALEVLQEETGGDLGWDVAIASAGSLSAAPWQKAPGFQEWMDRTANPTFQRYFANEISAEQLATQLEEGGDQIRSR